MPRRPTWNDVPRRMGGQFAPRMRWGDVTNEPGWFKTTVAIVIAIILNFFAGIAIAMLLDLSPLLGGALVLVAIFLSFPVGFFWLRYHLRWSIGYFVLLVILIGWVGMRRQQ